MIYKYSQAPFVRFVIPLIGGILFARILPLSGIIYLISLVLLLAFTITYHAQRYHSISKRRFLVSGICTCLSFFLIGSYVFSLHGNLNDDIHFSKFNNDYLLVKAKHYPEEKAKTYKIIGEVISAQNFEGQWKNTTGNILLYIEKDEAITKLNRNDHILIPANTSEVQKSRNPASFDYKSYLALNNIYHQSYIKKDQIVIFEQNENSLYTLSNNIKLKLIGLLDNSVENHQQASILSALLVGDKKGIDSKTYQAFAAAGAIHVLAVSGLHVGIIYLILNHILSVFFRFKKGKQIQVVIIVFCLWFYAFITGMSPSVIRASTMFSLVSVGSLIGRNQNIYNTISSSAFILLLVHPVYLFDIGFQLSYSAVLGIVFLYPKLYGVIHVKNSLLDKIWSLISVSISAQLATFPLALHYFHVFPNYFLLSNIVAVPLATCIMYVGITNLVCSSIPYFGTFLNWLLTFLVDALSNFVSWIQHLPYSISEHIFLNTIQVVFCYILIISCILWLTLRSTKYLRWSLILTSALIISSFIHYIKYRSDTFLYVYDIKNTSAVNFLSANQNIMIEPSTEIKDPSKLNFHLQNNWIKHSATEASFKNMKNLPRDTYHLLGHSVVGHNGYTIGLIQESPALQFSAPVNIDILIVSYYPSLQIDMLINNFNPQEIIFDASISKRLFLKIKKQIPNETKIHSVAHSGYYKKRLIRD